MNKNEKIILIFLLLGIGLGIHWYLKPWRNPTEPEIKPLEVTLDMVAVSEQEMIDAYKDWPELENPEPLGFVFEENAYETKIIEEPEQSEIELCGEYPCFTPQEFLDVYNMFEQQNDRLTLAHKYIYNNNFVDDYLEEKSIGRGYQKRTFADETDLVSFENVRTRPEVRAAYIAMRDELLEQDIRLHLVSAYRSSTEQRSIILGKLNGINTQEIPTGIHDDKIDEVLSLSALPGYSKHHSGYAVDLGCGNDYLVYAFAETECYAWMSHNNFENIKKYGFIPSYPEGIEKQGPNPEPWEYVWVGEEYIKKYSHNML